MRRIGKTGAPVRRVVATHRCGAEYTEGLLTRAREDARAAIRDMAQGVDPTVKAKKALEAAEREKAERAANTFEAFAEDYIKLKVPKLNAARRCLYDPALHHPEVEGPSPDRDHEARRGGAH